MHVPEEQDVEKVEEDVEKTDIEENHDNDGKGAEKSKDEAKSADKKPSSKKKKNTRNIIAGVCVVAIVGGLVAGMALTSHEGKNPTSNSAVKITDASGKTDEEIQKELDEAVEKSRISISIAPIMNMDGKGNIRANFIVEEPNNGLAERFEIKQEGQVVYTSEIYQPGQDVEWVHAPDVKEGKATAVVYAVSDGSDFGSPVSLEVAIGEGSAKKADKNENENENTTKNENSEG